MVYDEKTDEEKRKKRERKNGSDTNTTDETSNNVFPHTATGTQTVTQTSIHHTVTCTHFTRNRSRLH